MFRIINVANTYKALGGFTVRYHAGNVLGLINNAPNWWQTSFPPAINKYAPTAYFFIVKGVGCYAPACCVPAVWPRVARRSRT
jgi:hypothetical protein